MYNNNSNLLLGVDWLALETIENIEVYTPGTDISYIDFGETDCS